MLSNMIDRLFPLLSGWNNFEGIIGAVLALLLGLWIGWDWEWKKLGVFGLSCAVIYGLGVWIEESRIMYLAVLGMCAAALMPVLILWSVWMVFTGVMNWKEFWGSVTLLGWWLGQYKQLNWYFSAVWAFFLMAAPLYRLFCRTKHPVVLWLVLCAVTVVIQWILPGYKASMLMCRAMVFLTGMLFGRLEQLKCPHENRIRVISYLFLVLGLWYMVIVYRYDAWGLGYRLGIWWYPYAMFTPGVVILISDIAALLRRFSPMETILRPFELLGESSSEILMIHMAIYKVIQYTTKISNVWWVLVAAFCLAAGVCYQKFVVKKLPFS